MLGEAITLAATVFATVNDKGGNPYILHCLQVMQWVDQTDSELMQIAVLHDVVEDTTVTLDDLYAMGFSPRVISAIAVLTHDDAVPYDEYITTIATNADAVKVKLADLRHNSDITRIKGLRKKDIERLDKYHRSYVFLSQMSGSQEPQ